MRDVLEYKRHGIRLCLLLQQRVRQLQQVAVTLEVVPRRGVSVRHLRGFRHLPPIDASLALEHLVRVTALGRLVQLEELSQVLLREVALNILLLVHNT